MRAIFSSVLLSAVSLVGLSKRPAIARAENPPFALAISLNPQSASLDDSSDKEVRSGSDILLRIRKTNTSDQEITKRGHDNGAWGFNYEVRNSSGNPPPPRHRRWIKSGGEVLQPGRKEFFLQPGESETEYAPLTQWFDMAPGVYTIQVSQHVSSNPNSVVVESNKITVTVTP